MRVKRSRVSTVLELERLPKAHPRLPAPRRVCPRAAFRVMGVWMAGEPCRLLGAAGMRFFTEGQDGGAGGTLRTAGAPGNVSGPGPGAVLTHLLISRHPAPCTPRPRVSPVLGKDHGRWGHSPPGAGVLHGSGARLVFSRCSMCVGWTLSVRRR